MPRKKATNKTESKSEKEIKKDACCSECCETSEAKNQEEISSS